MVKEVLDLLPLFSTPAISCLPVCMSQYRVFLFLILSVYFLVAFRFYNKYYPSSGMALQSIDKCIDVSIHVSWAKIGREHLLSIGPDVWVRDSRYSIEYQEGPEEEVSHWDLKVRKVALEDEGSYQCQIISTEPLVRTVQLEIVVITIEGKKFVESAQTAYIRCNATEGNRFPHDIDWFKNGDKIDSMTYPNIVITKYRSEMTLTLVSELAITKASAQDSGTYICRSSAQLIASVDVNVLVADKSNVKRGHFSNVMLLLLLLMTMMMVSCFFFFCYGDGVNDGGGGGGGGDDDDDDDDDEVEDDDNDDDSGGDDCEADGVIKIYSNLMTTIKRLVD
ncbi:kin of irre-like protein 2 [Plakobranchus ocellatus]|uniref:Kin of irre-like protein 2 n=1 Tax=Plakobranchus ocellatus TaxID=259542 RepID=A0AAV4CYG1_9GAST|nr:kin of irre-like protein 2 [Plakobranchus ocellatus]